MQQAHLSRQNILITNVIDYSQKLSDLCRDLKELMKLTAFHLHDDSEILLRSVIGRVAAGFPVEIVGEEELIDLNYMCSKGSKNVRVILVEGDSMCPEIQDGDLVVIFCDREPQSNDIVIARMNGGLTVKRFKTSIGHRKGLYLVPANPEYRAVEVVPANEMEIIGVVSHIVRKLL